MAIQVNLLPWREELREKQRKISVAFIVTAILAGLLIFGASYSYNIYVGRENDVAQFYLAKENTRLLIQLKEFEELKKRHEILMEQVAAIESLQNKRGSTTHLLEDLSKAASTIQGNDTVEIFLNKYEINDDKIHIEGVGKNDAQVASFMRVLAASEWYGVVDLLSFGSQPEYGEEVKVFSIDVSVTQPEEKQIATSKAMQATVQE